MDKRKYKTEKDLPSDFTCPICFCLPPGKVFQCKNGHTLCEKCLKTLEEAGDPPCHTCRQILKDDGLIQCSHTERILDSIRLDCCFTSNRCQEINMEREDLQKHQESCRYDPEKFGTSVECCQLLFDPDCPFGITLGNGKAAKEHFVNEHNCIVKKTHKFEIEVDELIQRNENNTSSFFTPILVELEEEKCLILISPLYNAQQNSVGFLPIFIPTDGNKTEQCSVQLELSQGLRTKFAQIPIIFNKLEAILPNLEQLPKRRTSSNGGEKVSFHFQPKSTKKKLPERNSVRVQMFSCGSKTRKPIRNNRRNPGANNSPTTGWLSRFMILMAIGIACLGCVVWYYGVHPKGNKMEHGNIPNLSLAKNIYVPKDKNGNFLPMSPTEAKTTYWEVMNSEGVFKEVLNSKKPGAEGWATFSGEMGGVVAHLLQMMKTDEERKIEFIKQVDLFSKEEQKGSEVSTNEKEIKAVGQVLNVLVNRYQEQVLDQLKLLFENGTVKVAEFSEETQSKLLYLACRHNTENVVRFFIEMGIPVNAISSNGLIPLHYAVENENDTAALKICEVLVKNGADCNIRSLDKLTPLELATESKGEEFVGWLKYIYYHHSKLVCNQSGDFFDKLFFEASVKAHHKPLSSEEINKLFYKAAMFGTWDGLKYLLENVAEEEIDVNSANFGFIHIIFVIDFDLNAENSNRTRGLEKIKFLVEEKGADINAEDKQGLGYIFYASRFGTADAVEYFLNKGLKVKVEESRGSSLLQASVENKDEVEGVKIGRILLQNGAKCVFLVTGVGLDEEKFQKFKRKLDFLYESYMPECLNEKYIRRI